jgi:hypothetical protein
LFQTTSIYAKTWHQSSQNEFSVGIIHNNFNTDRELCKSITKERIATHDYACKDIRLGF